MTLEIKVPQLGESITEATVGQWFKSVGDAVARDEPLVELETDKVTVEVNAQSAGTLAEIAVAEGENVAVGALLGQLTEGNGAAPKKADSPPPAPEATTSAPSAGAAAETMAPSARKLVEEKGLDPALIPATGKDGRITKGDVLAHVEGSVTPAPMEASVTAASAADTGRSEERVRMSRLRQRIAERLKEAQETAAMLTTFNEVDMTNIKALRAKHQASFEAAHGVRLGFMSFFVKASVTALHELPAVNAQIDGTDIVYRNYADIGVAVGTEQGLVVPVLRDAQALSFADIEKGIGALGAKARDGKLTMDDLTGGTFTISNGGVYGSLLSTPILNTPQSGILGMHTIQDRPVAIDGEIVIRPMMNLALSYDHRVIDGREAVTFLIRIKECIEDPERMLLDI